MIFASTFDGFPVVERVRAIRIVGLHVLSNVLWWASCVRLVRLARREWILKQELYMYMSPVKTFQESIRVLIYS